MYITCGLEVNYKFILHKAKKGVKKVLYQPGKERLLVLTHFHFLFQLVEELPLSTDTCHCSTALGTHHCPGNVLQSLFQLQIRAIYTQKSNNIV